MFLGIFSLCLFKITGPTVCNTPLRKFIMNLFWPYSTHCRTKQVETSPWVENSKKQTDFFFASCQILKQKIYVHWGHHSVLFWVKQLSPKCFLLFSQFTSSRSIFHLPSAIYNQPSTNSHLPSAIYHQPSTISHLPSVINNQQSEIILAMVGPHKPLLVIPFFSSYKK